MRGRLTGPRLGWLHSIIDEERGNILAADPVERRHMNLKSFVYRVLSNRVVGDLPTKDATSFKETLAILLEVRADPNFVTDDSKDRLSEGVQWIQRVDQNGHGVVAKLYTMFPFLVATPHSH
jgi:hypothetical protein